MPQIVYHWPHPPRPATRALAIHGLAAETLDPSAADIAALLESLRRARAALLTMTTAEVIAALARAAAAWGLPDHNHPTRQAVAAATGLPADEVDLHPIGGPRDATDWSAAIAAWLAADGLDPNDLGRRRRGPPLVFASLTGLIAYPAITTVMAALLARSAILVKPGSDQPVSASHWAALLETADPRLGAAVAVVPWAGGSPQSAAIEAAVLTHADLVIAHGRDATIQSLRAACPAQTRFMAHPDRFSMAVIDDSALTTPANLAATADDVWLDATPGDLSGCLSPAAVFVISPGGGGLVRELTDALAESADRTPTPACDHRPPQVIAAVRSARQAAECAALAGSPVRVVTPRGDQTRWTIIAQARPLQPLTLWPRILNVVGVDSLDQIAALLGPACRRLSTFALAADGPRRHLLVRQLAHWSVPRLTAVGLMQRPPLAWHHDGRSLLGDLLDWHDCELGLDPFHG